MANLLPCTRSKSGRLLMQTSCCINHATFKNFVSPTGRRWLLSREISQSLNKPSLISHRNNREAHNLLCPAYQTLVPYMGTLIPTSILESIYPTVCKLTLRDTSWNASIVDVYPQASSPRLRDDGIRRWAKSHAPTDNTTAFE